MIKLPRTIIANESAFQHIGSLIGDMVSLFGMHSLHPRIAEIYEAVLGESLAFPLGIKPRGHSRINHDGTPIQFAVTLGKTAHRSFQFLGEAGKSGISGIDRFLVNRNCISSIAEKMQLQSQLIEASGLINKMVPETYVDLLNDPGGAFWIGAGFASSTSPQLKIYMNGTWGSQDDRWKRLSKFAAHFGVLDSWEKLIDSSGAGIFPLGTAITLKRGAAPSGRIYLSAYGKRMSYYEEFSKRICNDNFLCNLREFAKMILAEDYIYPTQTAVCSFGLGEGSEVDYKFELCGHCIFKSDVEAFSRIKSWLNHSSLESSDYQDVLGILSGGQLSKTDTELHCYIGVGQKESSIYSTVYLKPRLYGINGQYQGV
jgi:hypothetical protein